MNLRVLKTISAGCLIGMMTVAVSAAEVQPVVKAQAREFPLSAVQLLDGPFKQAMDVDVAYLLRLDPDRLLAGYRREAGLPQKAEPYGGWEALPRTGRHSLIGHSLGHYLSALTMMTAATGNAECKKRVEYIVDELAACQATNGNGSLCGFPESKQLFAEITAGDIRSDRLFGLNGGYVPLYNLHKVMAGLRDAWWLLGNRTARDVLVRKADWFGVVFGKLTDDQVQQVLETEHGGVIESFADVYAITGDAKYLALARRLNHKSFFDPLVRREDLLTKMHANAQIPKVIGMERIYELTGEKDFGAAARFFWDNVVNLRSFSIGGHGSREFFFATNAFATEGISSTTGPETCNTYNMLKLSRQLWLVEPSVATADFVERALYNHILSSQDPEHGGFVYFTSMRPGHYRTYCNDRDDFWCCTGTGMENHAKYGEFIYAQAGDRLWVDLLVASELKWPEQGATVKLDTRFPENGKATLTFTLKEPRKLSVALRCPGWLKPGAMKLAVNGVAEKSDAKPGSYAVVERTWKTGDKLEVDWPMAVRTELLPGSKGWVSVLWGPVVLAAEMGLAGLETFNFNNSRQYIASRSSQPMDKAPVFIGTTDDVVAKVKPVTGTPLAFRTDGLAAPAEVALKPFYAVHRQRYAVYWKLADRATYDAERQRIAEQEKAAAAIEAGTIDRVIVATPGSEGAHNVQSEGSVVRSIRPALSVEGSATVRSRSATNWFSYELKTAPDAPVVLIVQYQDVGAINRDFNILVDGTVIASERPPNLDPLNSDQFKEKLLTLSLPQGYPIPLDLTRGKEKIVIRFEAKPGSVAGPVSDVRILRKPEMQ